MSSDTRSTIIDAALALLLESGYASVTSRNIGLKAGLKSNLLHYYFATMDDLFIAVYHRFSEDFVRERMQVLGAERPMRRLWEASSNPRHLTGIYEFVALGNHKKDIREEILKSGNQLRDLDEQIVRAALHRRGLTWIPWLPAVATVVFESVARTLALHNMLGLTLGRRETVAVFERIIDFLDNPPK